MNKYLFLSTLSLLTTLSAQAERVETLQDNRVIAKSAVNTTFLGNGSGVLQLDLPEVPIELSDDTPGMMKTGVVYALPTPVDASKLAWERVTGGYVTRIRLVSNQAKRLRYHLTFNQAIPSAVFRLQGNLDAAPLKPIHYDAVHDHTIWLPITNGNQADLEIFVAETVAPDSVLTLDRVNIMVVNPTVDKQGQLQPKKLNLAQQPQFDVACFADNPAYAALQQAASATALIHIIPEGSSQYSASYSCTGTLLNDKAHSHTPWFATANHCINNQQVAKTLSFEWFFQAKSCGGGESDLDARHKITGNGGQLLWTDVYKDFTLLKLAEQPPEGVSYMGWDDAPLNVSDSIWGVHHPQGDHTMASSGEITNLSVVVYEKNYKKHLVDSIKYQQGTVEPGSSGSGLFSVIDGSAFWRGTASMVSLNDPQTAYYSVFSSYYPNIKQWLGEKTSTPTPEPEPEPDPDLSANAGNFIITGKQFNSPRNNKRLRVDVSGPVSTNAVYVWADVQGLGEFCYSPATDWTLPIPNNGASGTLASGKAHCQEPAGYLSKSKVNASASIDILNGMDISAPLFDKTRVYVDLQPAGDSPTAEATKNKVLEIGGSDW